MLANDADATPDCRPRRMRVALRVLPVAALILVLAGAMALGFDSYLSFEALARHRDALTGLVERHGLLAGIGFVALYAAVVAASIPGAVILTLSGGFLFGVALGSLYAVVGATLGSVAVFLAARTALGDSLRRRAAPWLHKLETGFCRNAFSYMLALRLVPLFPFWLVNLVPALLGVRLSTYTAATAIGIIPATVVYAGIGDGLGAVLDAGGEPDLGHVLQPRVLLPLLGLAALALLPPLVRRLRGRWRVNHAPR